MIITCPHCQTKYQVTYEAIGSAGRKVQCAHCHQAWDQHPLSADLPPPPDADQAFSAMAEDQLDEAMASEEKSFAVEAALNRASQAGAAALPGLNAAEMKKRQADFSRRRNAMISRLPLARVRRAARVLGMVGLVALLSTAYFGRVHIVDRYPDLAGLYAAMGMGVNVVGLEFSNLETLKTLSGGNDVLMVSAQIVGLTAEPVRVPPVVVSLLDADGHAVYEWSVTPRVRDLMAGERATFDTRLSLPPSEATRVRLSFAGGNGVQSERSGTADAGQAPAPAPIEHQ